VDHREQEQGVGAGADEVVLVGLLGGAAAAGVDHDHLAAAVADAPQAAAHVGRGQQAAVGGERVGPEDQQVICPVDVRDRDAQPGTEHVTGRDLLRHLVDGAGGEDVAGSQRLDQHPPVEDARKVVGGGVADVDADRLRAVLANQRNQSALDLAEGIVPAHRLKLAVAPQKRRAHAVRVRVDIGEAGPLRADEPGAEHVPLISSDAGEEAVGEAELEAAGRLAEGAGRVRRRLRHEPGS
jgi:hypothetical protein